MKNRNGVLLVRVLGIIALVAVIGFSFAACGGGKSLNSPEALKEYLDKQPANSPDKPIKVSMTINDPMLKNVAEVIKSAGKYVSLNISGSALTTIPDNAFRGCENIINVTIPNSVTSIGDRAFYRCDSLTSVTIPSSVTSIGDAAFQCSNLTSVTFQGTNIKITNEYRRGENDFFTFYEDLGDKYLAGGIGTYKRASDDTWTKQ